jgi:Zn-dependent protease
MDNVAIEMSESAAESLAYEPIHPGSGRPGQPGSRRRLGAALAAVVAAAAKAKSILILLPKLKLLTTFGSALVSIGAYALLWGWPFAVGFVALLLVHEMGHVLQLRREGIPASAPFFIPFLGAVVGMKRMPDDAAAEARVGLAGPVLGAVGVLAPLALWALTGDGLFQALAFVGFVLNLFNLLPVLPLDGGRAMAALSPWAWVAGLVALGVLMVVWFSPILLLVLLLGGSEVFSRVRAWRAKDPAAMRFHAVPSRDRVLILATYVALLAVLGVGAWATYLPKTI